MTDSSVLRHHRRESDIGPPPQHYSPLKVTSSPFSRHLKTAYHEDGSASGGTQGTAPPATRAEQLPPLLSPRTFSPPYYPRVKAQTGSPGSPSRPVQVQVNPAFVKPKNAITRSDPLALPVHLGNRRTFRQRRKDPSCDSCRERKVKCDATDNISCSECSQRGVKCQFTKDTNRRMTSTKQVSDLEKQLVFLKRENERLRAIWDQDDAMELDNSHLDESKRPFSPSSFRATRYRKVKDLSPVQNHLTRFSEGIFDFTILGQVSGENWPDKTVEIDSRLLPPSNTCSRLLNLCRQCPHPCFSSIPWQKYFDDIETFHNTGQLKTNNTTDAAVLLALIAFGLLLDPTSPDEPESGQLRGECIQNAARYCIDWREKSTVNLCLAALIISAYWLESGSRPSAWAWLGISVAVASNIGILGCDLAFLSEGSTSEQDIWKSVILWDRLLCLELSKSALIDAADFKITLFQTLQPGDSDLLMNTSSKCNTESYRWMKLLLPCAQVMISLQRTLRLSLIPADVFANQLKSIHSLAESLYSKDPRHLAFSTLPQSLQVILSRHNINPSHPVEVRREAFKSCYDAARRTALLIESSIGICREAKSILSEEKPPSAWKDSLCSSTTSFLCTHIWRCAIISSANLDFDLAIVFAQVGSVIGGSRRINISCSWSTLYFLERLATRFASDKANIESFLNDSEILAYITTDLQGDPRFSWVWDERAGFEPSFSQGDYRSPSFSYAVHKDKYAASAESSNEHAWNRVADLLVSLKAQMSQQRPLPSFRPSSSSKLQLEPTTSESSDVIGFEGRREKLPSSAGGSGGGSEMMNIKNII